MQSHIVKSFDEEIDLLKKLVRDMADACISQINDAASALKTVDTEKAMRIVDTDKNINALQREIEDLCVKILALRQPVAHDLRYILGTFKIASDLERIGDYAANIAKRVQGVAQHPEQETINRIILMAENCSEMIALAAESFFAQDVEKAGRVWHQDDVIDSEFAEMMRLVHQKMQEDKKAVEPGSQMIIMGRCCERIGDHITNIAEDICYIATGQNLINLLESDS